MTHKHYLINEHGRDFVMGDLHGCYDLLLQKLEALEFDQLKDRLFSVGDVIDRGPDSLKCLQLIRKHWFHMVLGNHEDFMLASVLNGCIGSQNMWMANGGLWAASENPSELHNLCLDIEKTPVAITVATKDGDIGICHAEPPSLRWSDAQTPSGRDVQTMLWARTRVKQRLDHHVEGVVGVYCGHTPLIKPTMFGNVMYIDTGAFHNNNLTVLPIEYVARQQLKENQWPA